MSNSSEASCLGILVVVGHIADWLGSGYIAWNWVEPDSLESAILFLLAWGIIGYVFQIVLGLVIAAIGSTLD